MHIALYGYTYENTVAFFPLYPFIVKYISWIVSYVIPILNIESILVLVFFGVNFYLFIKTALIIFQLTRLFHGVKFAYNVALIFCFNPASIFFSAPYSESLFCYLTFQSILHITVFSIKWVRSNSIYFNISDCVWCIIPVSLSAATRSNGVLNIIFFIYVYLEVSIHKVFSKKNLFCQHAIILSILLLVLTVIMLIPFIIVQMYDYLLFCSNFQHDLPKSLVTYAENQKLILWGTFSKNNQSWCHQSIPFAYSYVQDQYWNVGFLKYYQIKQLPNFCLAFPLIYIGLKGIINYLRDHPRMLLHLGIFRKLFVEYKIMNSPKEKDFAKLLLLDIEFACIVHCLFLIVFCILCIHVQVTTRMIFSSSPIIYWFCCQSLYSQNSKEVLFIKSYYIIYFVLGTIMFCNFLPWT